jgi:hypothetical protein
VCAQEGTDTDAVAICIVCGMGLCIDHAIRDDLEFWEGELIRTEMVKETELHVKIPKKLPRFLCKECFDVLLP